MKAYESGVRPSRLHLTRILKTRYGEVGEAESSVRSAMSIETTGSPSQAPEERHAPIVAGLTGHASRPRNMPLLRSLAVTDGSSGYKHGAPDGAFQRVSHQSSV